MTQPEPRIETIDATDAREQWEALLHRVGARQARFLVARDGEPVAAIVSAHDLEILTRYLQQREERFKAFDELQEQFKDVPPAEIEREIERVIGAVRSERRATALADAATS